MNQANAILANNVAQQTYRLAFKANTYLSNIHRQYILDRGFSLEALAHFGVGYCSGKEVVHQVSALGLTDDALEAGLIAKFDDKPPYERFWKRLTFPIRRHEDHSIVGFGGRTLNTEKAKYVNSPESPLFKKRDLLYGLNTAKQAVVELDCAILCEGYLDLIALWQIGIYNAVATMGTAFSAQQVMLLKPFTNNILVCMDGDLAGKTSADKAIALSKAYCMNAETQTLPEGQDPGEYALHSPNEMHELLKQQPSR